MAQVLFIVFLFCVVSRIFVEYVDVIMLIFLSSQYMYVFCIASKKNRKKENIEKTAVEKTTREPLTETIKDTRKEKKQNVFSCMKQQKKFVLGVFCICYFLIIIQFWSSSVWNEYTIVNNVSSHTKNSDTIVLKDIDYTQQEQNAFGLWQYSANTVARFIVDKTTRYADEDSAGLLSALLVGRKQYLSGALRDISRRAGASHLLALSGFHLNLLLYVLLQWKGKVSIFLQASISLLIVWFYCIWLGFIPSLYRAAIMFTVALLCKLLWGNIHFISLWSITSIIFLLSFSKALSSVGLVLSQLALIGVVYGNAMFPHRLDSYIPPVITQSFSIGVGALITTAWYSFIVFKAVYPVALFSAIILTPLVIMFILCGILLLVLPHIFSLYIGIVVQILASIIRLIMSYASSIMAIEKVEHLVLFYGGVCFLLLFTLYCNRDVKRKQSFIISGYHAYYSLQKTDSERNT